MSYFKGILRSSNHRPNQEEEAIQTLSNRLQHATLSTDRKSAVLGLKSFSRQFRENVVQYGLRGLLQTLGKDAENAQLVKAVLETLLNLYLRTSDGAAAENETLGWISNRSRAQNGKYPSPLLVEQIEIDEFSNWIADEMISADTHVQNLMLILQQHTGFQIRLYALQLLEAVVATRPIRAKECILNIPLAISTIVGLLDDPNDPIRNETILLLMALVNNNFNIQKLVAFENTFSRIFEIIEEEGGIRGSILVQDCMTLLSNLLTYNASNQTFFLETDCVPKLARLIAEPLGVSDEAGDDIPAPPVVWTEQRLQNMATLLDICRSFVDAENQHLVQNQEKLFSTGIFFSILRLVFSPAMENPIRKSALQVTGDIVANNAQLQLQFAQIDVPYVDPSMPVQVQNYTEPIPAPLALLNWAVLTNSVHIFEVRLASMYCLAKFFSGNPDAKMAFLLDQIKACGNPNYYSEIRQQEEGEQNPEKEETGTEITKDPNSPKTPYANIFSTLTTFNFDVKLNPYSVWFSAITLVYLISDCPETRAVAREMKVGNAADGEEEMTAIQAISGMLLANLENTDPRIAVGYLVLLTLWLYEDFDAVNDFLSDASVVKSLVAFLSKNSTESSEMVLGMAAILVGVCYDFSTKVSPLPRASLYELITKSLGADSYALKVKQFKNSALFKQFDGDMESDFERDSSGLPNLFFIPEYVELVKDNYYRIRKSLSRGPHFEPRSRISFEIFEELENKNVELKKELEDLTVKSGEAEKSLQTKVEEYETKLKEATDSLEKCQAEALKAQESEDELVSKIEKLSQSMASLEAEKQKFESSSAHYTSEYHKLSKKSANSEESMNMLKQKLQDVEAAKQRAEDGINKMSRELFQLTKQKKEADSAIASLEKEQSKAKTQHEKTVKDYQIIVDAARKTNDELRAKLTLLEQQGFRAVSSSDEKTVERMRDLQVKVSEMEETNDNLMEKLRSAAVVVQGLRAEKSELEKEKQTLESELVKAYEDLAELTQLFEEVQGIKENEPRSAGVISGDTHVDTTDCSSDLAVVLKEKAKLEDRLRQATENIEGLQSVLADVQAKLEEERKTTSSPKETSSERNGKESTGLQLGDENGESEQQADARVNDQSEELLVLRASLQESEDTLKTETERYNKEIDSLTSQHHELLKQHNTLEEEHQKVLDELSTREVDARKVDMDAVGLKKKDAELDISQKRIKDLERNIEVLSESASTSLASFKRNQDALKSRIEELEDTKTKALEEIDSLKQEREKMVNEFQEAYDELDSAYMDLELSSTNLEKHKEDLEKQLKKHQHDSSARIEKLTAENEALNKSLTEIRGERDHLRREYYELEKSTNIIGSELQAKEALLQAISNKGADLAAKDKIVIEIKEKLASTIMELGDSAQKFRVLGAEKADLAKLHEENVAELERMKQKINDLESQIASKSEQLEESLVENRKLISAQKNFTEANKANDGYLAEIEALESEAATLKESLSEVQQSLDEQRKLNCEHSSAAVLEFTEKSTKLEKSILENQQLHDVELAKIRESTEKEIQDLSDALVSLKEENKRLSAELTESQRLASKAEADTGDLNDYKERAENVQKELEQSKLDLQQCQEKLSEQSSELELTSKKLKDLSENHEENLQRITSEIGELKSELQKWKDTASEREEQIKMLTEEKTSLMDDIEGLRNSQKELVSENTTSLPKSDDAVESPEKQALKEAEAEVSEKILELERQAEALKEASASIEDLERRIEENSESRKEAEHSLKNEIRDLEEELRKTEAHVSDVADLSNGKILNGVHGEDYEENDDETQSLEREVEALKAEAQKEQSAHKESTDELRRRLEERSRELAETESKLKDQDEKLAAAVEDLKKTHESFEISAQEKEASWQEQVQRADKNTAAKETEIVTLREEIDTLEGKLKTSPGKEAESDIGSREVIEKAAGESPDDIADLVLLCDFQEKKIEKYKRKLRALDIAVSSDESDDDLL